ncbi:hypothetical protein ACVDG3_18785 [Meridianimarinicoccus sp. RP-17]|uniref:hypothetical protein n=1 Tax=Meridianimarinicoccus zhengii TaxID=2056810 RepID=UPI000DAEAFD0|nr:hypothetical protein [Phycocomes zhengii]
MTKTTGRPANYGYNDLARALAKAEADFGSPSAAQVKTILCEQLGIPKTLNAASFQAALAQFHEDREAARQKAVVAALPERVRTRAVAQIRGPLEHALLVVLGESYDTVQADAARRVAEAEQLTRDVTFKLRHLEAVSAERDGTIEAFETECDAKRARIAELESEVTNLRQQLAEQSCAVQTENRVLDVVAQILTGATAAGEQKTQVTQMLQELQDRPSDAA